MKIPLFIGIGFFILALGVGMYVTDFTAYLGSDPQTCNNCHVMDTQYAGWYSAGHRDWATCSDCHTPHAFIPKYLYKAKSGMNDVFVFSTGNIPTAIRTKSDTKEIVQENCIRCHAEAVSAMLDGAQAFDRQCYDCHRSVAHGDRGFSSLPYQDQEMSK
jgi:cytochrome c nitrite reductase small subunit